MGVAQGIGENELGQDTSRQAEVDADREGVPAPHAATDADDEPVVDESLPNGLDQRVGCLQAAVDDGATSDLDDVAIRQHAHHRRLGR